MIILTSSGHWARCHDDKIIGGITAQRVAVGDRGRAMGGPLRVCNQEMVKKREMLCQPWEFLKMTVSTGLLLAVVRSLAVLTGQV